MFNFFKLLSQSHDYNAWLGAVQKRLFKSSYTQPLRQPDYDYLYDMWSIHELTPDQAVENFVNMER
ncbi:hypothetical protein GCM10027341_44910 [Spirosoma knui]